jgi:hypothetical protein
MRQLVTAQIVLHKFPIPEDAPDGNISEKLRRAIYMLNLFVGGSDCLKNGTIVNPGLGLLDGIYKVQYVLTSDMRLRAIWPDGTHRLPAATHTDVTSPLQGMGERKTPEPKLADAVTIEQGKSVTERVKDYNKQADSSNIDGSKPGIKEE